MLHLTALRRGYVGVAIIWLNVCLAFAAANAVALGYLAIVARRASATVPAPADLKPLRQVLRDLSDEDLTEFLGENTRAFQYEAFTQFREKPFHGRWVTVDEAGFRHGRDQGPWPPDPKNFNVFVFGGSTTFGYGVPDDNTIPSYLQMRLGQLGLQRPPRIYNFGRGGYFSSQERTLFETLLVGGVVPDLAIFIDGLNDFFFKDGVPALTPWLTQMVAQHGAAVEPSYGSFLVALPLTRALQPRALATLGGYPAPPPNVTPTKPARFDDQAVLLEVIRRWRTNKRLSEAVAREFGVQILFVWQPVPTYAYEGPPRVDLGFHEYSRFGYPLMAEIYRKESLGPNFVWCADVQKGLMGLLYVDQVHYSPAMSDRIASCIVDGLRTSGL